MKKLSEYLNYLILSVIVGFIAIYFVEIKKVFIKHEITAPTETKPATVNVDEVVNKYMKQTEAQILRERVESELALRRQLNRPIVIKKAESVAEINPEDIPVEQQIWKDSKLKSMSAAESKKSQQEFEENLKRQDEQEKKEFARQYIENARKDGYHVVLSPDLKVLSVTPIRQPSQSNDSTESFPSQ